MKASSLSRSSPKPSSVRTMTSSQSSSAKVGVYMASRTSAGSSFHRSRLSFSPPWLGVETLWTPSATSSTSCVQPQGV